MNLGTQNKRNTILAAVLLVIAVGVFLRMVVFPLVLGGDSPSKGTAPARATQAAHENRPKRVDHHLPSVTLSPSLDPRLRLDLLKHEQESLYAGNGRNIFVENSEPIPMPLASGLTGPNGPKRANERTKFAPTQPPPPPPINLKFFGFANKPGEPRRIFLSQSDGTVLLAHEGDIVGERYKILHIGPNSVEVEDVLSNNRQSIPLSQS
jgi:hypothetical protein